MFGEAEDVSIVFEPGDPGNQATLAPAGEVQMPEPSSLLNIEGIRCQCFSGIECSFVIAVP